MKGRKIKKNWEIQKIFAAGKRIYSNSVVMFVCPSPVGRIAISVPKKLAGAVTRNLNKRQVKMIIRQHNLYLEGYDVVLVVRQKFLELTYSEKILEVKRTFNIWYAKNRDRQSQKAIK